MDTRAGGCGRNRREAKKGTRRGRAGWSQSRRLQGRGKWGPKKLERHLQAQDAKKYAALSSGEQIPGYGAAQMRQMQDEATRQSAQARAAMAAPLARMVMGQEDPARTGEQIRELGKLAGQEQAQAASSLQKLSAEEGRRYMQELGGRVRGLASAKAAEQRAFEKQLAQQGIDMGLEILKTAGTGMATPSPS